MTKQFIVRNILNDVDNAYRDMSMDVSFSGGMYALEIGSNGIAPVLSQGSSILPANTTLPII